jgi:ectoine hydroxylase-related dioxygenase (phytanoyl-CoA dioxygenase family)
MSAVLKQPAITDQQVEAYRDKGYVVVQDIFSGAEIQQMRDVLEELCEKARGLTAHDSVYDLEASHSADAPRVRRIKSPHQVHPIYWEMACHPRLVEVLQRLVAPTLRLHGAKINLKSAAYGAPVEWHQDWAFYPHTNDDVLAVGVMLDDMTEDNGPLLCVPGSHRGPTHDHHQDGHFAGAMDPQSCGVDFASAEQITGPAGSCSFHHVRTVHGSAMNTSGRDRRLLLYQVAAGDAWDVRGMEVSSWDEYEKTMIAGKASNQPRVVPCPIRLPYPEPLRGGSIYESQTVVRNKYFGEDSP